MDRFSDFGTRILHWNASPERDMSSEVPQEDEVRVAYEPSYLYDRNAGESALEEREETFIHQKQCEFCRYLWHELKVETEMFGLKEINLGDLGKSVRETIDTKIPDERDRVLYRRAFKKALWDIQQAAKDEIADAVIRLIEQDTVMIREAMREAMLACLEVGDEDLGLPEYISAKISDLLGLPRTGWAQLGDLMTEPKILNVLDGEVSDTPREGHPTTQELYNEFSMSIKQSRISGNEGISKHVKQCHECDTLVMRWFKEVE